MDAPVYQVDDPLVKIMFKGRAAERARLSEYREGPIDTFADIMSNDPRLLRFKDNLSRKLSAEHSENVDEYGRVYGNGLISNFYGIRHVSGFPMKPSSYPLYSNIHHREKAGLANDFVKPWHKNVLKAIVRLFFSDLEPVSLRLRKGSSSVAPFFEKAMHKKMDIVRFSLNNAERAAILIGKGDHVNAWKNFQIGGVVRWLHRRQSSDAISFDDGSWTFKPRKVNDLEYAISGGERGSEIVASKALNDVDFSVPDGFARERNREVAGVPLGINSIGMPIAQAVRKRIYSLYSYSYHHTTREEMANDLRKWDFTIAADVASHDVYWPPFVLEAIADELLEMGYSGWWVDLFRMTAHLPYFVTGIAKNVPNVMIGDWRNPSSNRGLMSGDSFTDIKGTILMTWVYLILQIEHTAPQYEQRCQTVESSLSLTHQYLQGALPILLKDKSDDALLGWKSSILKPAAIKLQERMKKGESVSPYMIVGYEHGGAFLGNILLYPTNKQQSELILTGNIQSMLINQFSPEHGVDAKRRDRANVKRPFPGLAWETIPTVYGSCDLFSNVSEAIEREWFDSFGFSYRKYREDMLEQDKRKLRQYTKEVSALSGLRDLSLIDQEVLATPEKLMYKYTPDDVSSSVDEFLFHGLPLEEVEPFFNSVVPR